MSRLRIAFFAAIAAGLLIAGAICAQTPVPSAGAVFADVTRVVPPMAPPDVVGYVAGEFHGWARIITFLAGLMTAMRAVAEVLTKVSAALTGLAEVIPNPQLQLAAHGLAYIVAILGWFISVFSAGPPKSIPPPSFRKSPPKAANS